MSETAFPAAFAGAAVVLPAITPLPEGKTMTLTRISHGMLAAGIAEATGIAPGDVRRVLDALPPLVAAHLGAGRKVALRDLGTFVARQRAARRGRNPATGTEIEIPARRIVAFGPAALLKEAVDG